MRRLLPAGIPGRRLWGRVVSMADGNSWLRVARSQEVLKRLKKVSQSHMPLIKAGAVWRRRAKVSPPRPPPEVGEAAVRATQKKLHKHLRSTLCNRCAELSNGKMLNAVAGQAHAP
jgi:NMD protein affecting ribosome stability and mRNA decay